MINSSNIEGTARRVAFQFYNPIPSLMARVTTYRVLQTGLFLHSAADGTFLSSNAEVLSEEREDASPSRSETQITDGLSEGEIVVPHPPNRLGDGSRVSERCRRCQEKGHRLWR